MLFSFGVCNFAGRCLDFVRFVLEFYIGMCGCLSFFFIWIGV